MNAEELKTILDAISTVSGNASNAAVWWIALHYGTKIVGMLAAATTVVWVATAIIRVVAATNAWSSLGAEVSRAWGARTAMPGFIDMDARRAMRRAVDAALKEKNYD